MARTNFGISHVFGWSIVGDWRQWHHLAVVVNCHRKDHRKERFGERWDVKAPMGIGCHMPLEQMAALVLPSKRLCLPGGTAVSRDPTPLYRTTTQDSQEA